VNNKVIGGVSALAIGVIGTGVYLAVPASAGGSQNSAATASQSKLTDQQTQNAKQRAKQRAKRLRGVGVHGQATVRTKKGFVQIAWQRGQLTAKSGNSITVRSLDGTTWQWQTDGKTRVRKNGQKSGLSALAVKDFVLVGGPDAANNRHAAQRVIVPMKVPAKATQSPAPSHS
jgi:hypothetical protein